MRYVFGGYSLDTQRYELRRAGEIIPLGPQVFNVLAYLVTHRNRVVARDELFAYQATEVTRDRSDGLALLAETFAQVGQITKGLEALAEGLATVAKYRIRWWEAELYRLRGELLSQQTAAQPEYDHSSRRWM